MTERFIIQQANKDCFKIYLDDYYICAKQSEAAAKQRIKEMESGRRKRLFNREPQ